MQIPCSHKRDLIQIVESRAFFSSHVANIFLTLDSDFLSVLTKHREHITSSHVIYRHFSLPTSNQCCSRLKLVATKSIQFWNYLLRGSLRPEFYKASPPQHSCPDFLSTQILHHRSPAVTWTSNWSTGHKPGAVILSQVEKGSTPQCTL